jgi:hypothetical protein
MPKKVVPVAPSAKGGAGGAVGEQKRLFSQ